MFNSISKLLPRLHGSRTCRILAPLPKSQSLRFISIPTIDLSRAKAPAEKRQLAKEIDKACMEVGFMTVVGHSVAENLQQEALIQSRLYFDLPVAEKRKIQMTADYPYGYSGIEEENLSKGYGTTRRPDLKESFCMGPSDSRAGMPPPIWPVQPPKFKAAIQAYYAAMEKLSVDLLRCFALALNLEETWFDNKIDRHRSALRFLNYPEQTKTPEPGQIRAGEHTDYGSVTILLQDTTGGLQVKSKGQWIDVQNTPNSFIINLGDLMQRWTNDRWVSTPHRVINSSAARRQSIAFFHNINHDQVVECISTCKKEGDKPKYPPIEAWKHLMEKHQASTGY